MIYDETICRYSESVKSLTSYFIFNNYRISAYHLNHKQSQSFLNYFRQKSSNQEKIHCIFVRSGNFDIILLHYNLLKSYIIYIYI